MEYPKKINVTFTVDNQAAEYNIVTHLEGIGGKYLKILPNSSHLKDNEAFKKILKSKKKVDKEYYDFINKNRK